MNNFSVRIAWISSVMFLIVSLLGFLSDWLPAENALFETNTILNLTHLVTAFGFVIVAKQGIDASIHLIRVFGLTYMLISAIGFMGMNIQIGEQWSYAIYINFLNYVQFGVGVILSISGSILKKHRHLEIA